LDQDTAVTINAPPLNCPQSNCPSPDAPGDFAMSSGAGGASGGPPPVTVISQQVVGPYQTVQLQSTDPNALSSWLAQNGYAIPSDIEPIISAYISEGLDFLALKLVPGQGVSAMRPVRVTTTGASAVLPLRMVAAGTGTITPITLYVLAEGRYETVNLPWFKVDTAELVWNWSTQSSNYAALKQSLFGASKGRGWIVEDAQPFSMYQVTDQLDSTVQYDPAYSGYGDATGS